jgi:hypothetical protein
VTAPQPDPTDGAPQPHVTPGTAQPDPVFGAPQPDPAFGAPQPGVVFGAPQPDPAFGVPQPGAAQPDPAFGVPQPDPAFGVPQSGPAYGFPQSGPAYGAPQSGPAYGGPAGGQVFGGVQPAGPYPAPPGYAGPPPAGGTNGFAIASLIFGVLGGVLFSTIFGIVALTQVRKRNQGGRGLAIAGLTLSGCWVLLIAAMVTVGIVMDVKDDSASGSGTDSSVSVLRLKVGDCINGLKESSSLEDLPVVPCSAPHEGEVYALFDLADGPWPGDAAVQRDAEKRCNDEFDRYATAENEKLELFYLHPLARSWWRDRGVTCIATDPAGPSTGSLRD